MRRARLSALACVRTREHDVGPLNEELLGQIANQRPG
jgi:hypothetical protein